MFEKKNPFNQSQLELCFSSAFTLISLSPTVSRRSFVKLKSTRNKFLPAFLSCLLLVHLSWFVCRTRRMCECVWEVWLAANVCLVVAIVISSQQRQQQLLMACDDTRLSRQARLSLSVGVAASSLAYPLATPAIPANSSLFSLCQPISRRTFCLSFARPRKLQSDYFWLVAKRSVICLTRCLRRCCCCCRFCCHCMFAFDKCHLSQLAD